MIGRGQGPPQTLRSLGQALTLQDGAREGWWLRRPWLSLVCGRQEGQAAGLTPTCSSTQICALPALSSQLPMSPLARLGVYLKPPSSRLPRNCLRKRQWDSQSLACSNVVLPALPATTGRPKTSWLCLLSHPLHRILMLPASKCLTLGCDTE